VLPHHGAEPAAAEVAAHTDRGADPRGEPQRPAAVSRHCVVELPERGARPDRRHAARGIDADIAQRGDVDHGEGAGGASALEDRAVGEALVVVAAAAGADREALAPAAGDAGPHLGDGRRCQEQRRPRRPWGGEAEVLDGGVEQGSVGRRRRCVDEPGRVGGRRREARDAADEAPVEGDAAAAVVLLLRGTRRGEEEQEEEREVRRRSWSHHRHRLARHALLLASLSSLLPIHLLCSFGERFSHFSVLWNTAILA